MNKTGFWSNLLSFFGFVLKFIFGIVCILGTLAFAFLYTALIVYVIFWCFGLVFTWKSALGIWLAIILMKGAPVSMKGVFKNEN